MTDPTTPPAADRPAHYRLKTETWALVMKEYVEGATAPFLARKWRVSEHAVRRRITQHKATKRDWGDAQAISQALAREAELEETRRNSPEAVAGRLFDGVALDEAGAGEAAALMRVATLASGRAMKGRLWAEAKALAGLAESYARLADRARAAEAAAGTEAGARAEEDPAIRDWFSDDPAVVNAKRRQLFFALGGTALPAEGAETTEPAHVGEAKQERRGDDVVADGEGARDDP